MAFTSIDQISAAFPGQRKNFLKPSITSKAAGSFQDTFFTAGNPGAASNPAAFGSGGTLTTNTTNGCIPFTNPGSGNAYVGRIAMASSTAGSLILYDRVWACAGMSGTSASAQTIVSFPGLPARCSTGLYVEPWLQWYTPTGGTAATVTFQYTNSDNVASRNTTSVTVQATPVAYQMQPLPMQPGDVGVRVPVSVTLSGTTGTAGSFGVTLLRRILEIPMALVSVAQTHDVFMLGLPLVDNSSCLAAMVLCSTTNTGVIAGDLSLISG